MSDLNFWTADPHRTFSAEQLADASLPFADVSWNGELKLGKAVNSGGELSLATCAQQLLYEITDPAAYITPDVVRFCKVCCYPVTGHPIRPEYLQEFVQMEFYDESTGYMYLEVATEAINYNP